MEEKKAYKIVIVGVILYVIIMLLIFLPGYISKKRDKLYILSGDFIKIKYENGKWQNITDSDDYKLKQFEVFESGNYKGNYKILFTNKYYLYDSKGKNINYGGQLFSYSGTLKLGVVNVANNEITENDSFIIKEALNKLKINNFNKLNLYQKVSLDVDKDNVVENIYAISNYYVDENLDKVFSIVFVEKNGKIDFLIDKVISSDKIYDEPSYEINKIIDVKEDKKYEIMIEQSYFSRPEESCIILNKLYGNKKEIKNLCE